MCDLTSHLPCHAVYSLNSTCYGHTVGFLGCFMPCCMFLCKTQLQKLVIEAMVLLVFVLHLTLVCRQLCGTLCHSDYIYVSANTQKKNGFFLYLFICCLNAFIESN